MISEPLVSVIIPVKNCPKVSEAIQSILKQTYQNFEIVICYDGNTDKETENVIENYLNEKKVYVLPFQNVKGLSHARNRAIKFSNGKYLCFLDGDDLADKYRLEKQVAFLEKNQDIFLAGTRTNLNDYNYLFDDDCEPEFVIVDNRIFSHNQFAISSVMCRRDGVMFDENMDVCEDYALYLHLYTNKAKLAIMRDKLCTIYKHEYPDDLLQRHSVGRAKLMKRYNKSIWVYFEYHKYMAWWYMTHNQTAKFFRQILSFFIGDFPKWK